MSRMTTQARRTTAVLLHSHRTWPVADPCLSRLGPGARALCSGGTRQSGRIGRRLDSWCASAQVRAPRVAGHGSGCSSPLPARSDRCSCRKAYVSLLQTEDFTHRPGGGPALSARQTHWQRRSAQWL